MLRIPDISAPSGGPSLIEAAPSYQANVPEALSEYTYDATTGMEIYLGKPYRVTPDAAMAYRRAAGLRQWPQLPLRS